MNSSIHFYLKRTYIISIAGGCRQNLVGIEHVLILAGRRNEHGPT